jgi:hypothetical protein
VAKWIWRTDEGVVWQREAGCESEPPKDRVEEAGG